MGIFSKSKDHEQSGQDNDNVVSVDENDRVTSGHQESEELSPRHTSHPTNDPTRDPETGQRVIGLDDEYGDDDMVRGGPIKRRGKFYVFRKTIREFIDDECTDVAAALTYYSVLAIFPAMLAMVSLLGVVGEAESSVSKMLEILRPLVSAATLDSVEPTLRGLTENRGAGLTLIAGLLGALWSASAYVGAFGRAMNKILEVEEGRPFWKLRPMNLMVTLTTLLLCVAGLLILVISGPLAESIGGTLGLADQSVQIWEIAKWPVLGIIVVMAVGILYRFTPNVRMKFRVLTTGAFVAILVWLAASVGFAFYVGNFGNYNATYGAVAGVVVGLLWLWLTNLALLFGAELDSEIKRARQLHDGLPAEDNLQFEMRDDKGVKKAHQRRQKDILAGRAVRESHVGAGHHGDRPFGGRRG